MRRCLNPAIRGFARTMRNQPTPAEAPLWTAFLRHLTPQWHRQRAVDGYVLDFYCPALCLALEVDGTVHNTLEARHRDAARTRHLETLGLRVLRVRNSAVLYAPAGLHTRLFEGLFRRAEVVGLDVSCVAWRPRSLRPRCSA